MPAFFSVANFKRAGEFIMYKHALLAGMFDDFTRIPEHYSLDVIDVKQGYDYVFNNGVLTDAFGSSLVYYHHMPLYLTMPFLVGTNKLEKIPHSAG